MVVGWIVLSIALSALSIAMAPKPPKPEDAIAGDLDIPTPPQGRPIPVIFGKGWVKDAGVVYFGNALKRPIKSDGGKK